MKNVYMATVKWVVDGVYIQTVARRTCCFDQNYREPLTLSLWNVSGYLSAAYKIKRINTS